MNTSAKIRLDQLLVERYGYESRARARDAIKRKCVTIINGKAITRPGRGIDREEAIEIRDPALPYVSRAALKLVHALDQCHINPAGKTALDLGASTGGFTQVLLERGADRVIAVDVGSGQLQHSLKGHPRLIKLENLNVRDLTEDDLSDIRPDLVTSDLSFISLKIALPPALELAAEGATGIFLIKPQFEVGKDGISRGGIVRDETLIIKTVEDLGQWLNNQPGWRVTEIMPSPIYGGDGNREFLMIGHKAAGHE